MAMAQTGSLAYGETVTGQISDDESLQSWEFEGQAGEIITITMEAINLADGGLDSYLQLLDPDGSVIAENDDASNATINATISSFPLTEDGTYTIIATRFGLGVGTSVGEYELSLQLSEGDSPADEHASDENTSSEEEFEFNIGQIAFDEPVRGQLNTQNFAELWDFEGQEGAIISIQMTRQSNDLDTYIILIDDQGNELASNDDGLDGTASSEITGYSLPYSGLFTIVATRYGFESGTSRGEYELVMTLETGDLISEPAEEAPITDPVEEAPIVEATPEPSIVLPDQTTPLAFDQAVTNLVESPDQVDLYEFQAVEGQIVVVSVKRLSGELDPAVLLFDVQQTLLLRNDDFNGPSDARIAGYQVPADGVYQVAVIAQSEAEGEYSLRLFTVESLSPAAEAQLTPPEVPDASSEADVPATTEESESAATEATENVTRTQTVDGAALVFTLTWEGEDDFDLLVLDPDTSTLDYENFTTPSGGIFGGDANGSCRDTIATPSENAYWQTDPPAGLYGIGVGYVLDCDGQSDSVRYTVTVELNGQLVETFEGELVEGDFDTYTYEVE